MVLILKKNDGLRPLTLLPVLRKAFEAIIRNRIETHQNRVGGEHPLQLGFVKGKGSVNALKYVLDLRKTTSHKYLVGIFIDIEAAVDRTWWPMILYWLRQLKDSRILYVIVVDYFENKRTYLQRSGQWRAPQRGCPQGSVLGPTFWKLLMVGFLSMNYRKGVTAVAYVDGGVLIYGANSRRALEENEQP